MVFDFSANVFRLVERMNDFDNSYIAGLSPGRAGQVV